MVIWVVESGLWKVFNLMHDYASKITSSQNPIFENFRRFSKPTKVFDFTAGFPGSLPMIEPHWCLFTACRSLKLPNCQLRCFIEDVHVVGVGDQFDAVADAGSQAGIYN